MAQVKACSLRAMVQFHHPHPPLRPRRPYLRPVRSFETSSSISTLPLIDVDDFYDDPSDRLPFHHASNDDTGTHDDALIRSLQANGIEPPLQQATIDSVRLQPHVYGGQDESNTPVHHSHRGGRGFQSTHFRPHLVRSSGHHSNNSPSHSSAHRHGSSSVNRYSPSSMISGGGGGGDGRHPNNNYSKETQRAILNALTKLQRDVNNILERLNRLEASSQLIAQVSISSEKRTAWIPTFIFSEDHPHDCNQRTNPT